MNLKLATALAFLPMILTARAAGVPPANLTAEQLAVEKKAEADDKLPGGWDREGARKLFENDRGAVFNTLYPVNKSSPVHRHRFWFAGLDLNTAAIVTRKPGDTNWTAPHTVIKDSMWWLPKDLTHAEMTISNPGRHNVVVEIKEKHVPEAANTTNFPSNKFAPVLKQVVDNDKVTIWDAAWAPDEGMMSFDTRDIFLAVAEGGDLSIREDGNPAEIKHLKMGDALFLPGGKARAISSAPGTTVRAMLVEVK